MKLQYFRYRLPFVRPFQTSRQTFTAREGIILQLRHENITAYGEAAPLPGFSSASLEQVTEQLELLSPALTHLFKQDPLGDSLDDLYERHHIVPSLCYAIDTLACDFTAQKKGLTVNRLLFGQSAPSLIPVNKVIPRIPATEAVQTVRRYEEEGYRTFKFKIGHDFASELALLKKVRQHFPQLKIRVDANRAWSPDEALNNLHEMEGLDIEYCEEPLIGPTPALLEKIADSSSVPVALDETLADADIIQSVAPVVPVLILKPMIVGKISKLFATKRLADTHDNKVIITTALESGVGRMMAAMLASGLGTKHSAHGLATGNLLKVDVWYDGDYINNGNFSLPHHIRQDKSLRSNLLNIADEIYFSSG